MPLGSRNAPDVMALPGRLAVGRNLGVFLERTAVRSVNGQRAVPGSQPPHWNQTDCGEERATGEEGQKVRLFRPINSRVGTRLVVLAVAGAVVIAVASAGTASAAPSVPPGGDAAYQVEVSCNVAGKTGGGSWFWLELDKDGGGIYAGSDCAHGGGGASAERGALSWEQQGDQLVIHGVQSGGLPPFAYEPILVPASYGHYVETFADVFPTLTAFLTSVGVDLSDGSVQVQVAP
jgi:hypothetical protein